MPNLREHVVIDSKVFGVKKGKYRWVHQTMDNPQKIYGKYHRRYNHNPTFCKWLAMTYFDGLWAIYNGVQMPFIEAICLNHIAEDIKITKKRNAIAREKYQKGLNSKRGKNKT